MSKKRMLRLTLVALLTLSTSVGVEAQDAVAPPLAAKVDALIADLGSGSFQQREAATSELLSIGIEALPALSRAREQSDPEVRRRLGMITDRLAADDLEARIEAFLAGREGADLPGWAQAQRKMGDKPVLRELFVELTREHPQLAASLSGSPRERTAALQEATAKIQAGMMDLSTTPTIADAIGLLLAAGDEHTPPSEAVDTALLRLFGRAETAVALQDAELSRPVRELIGEWLPRVTKSRRAGAMFFAMQSNIPEGLLLAATTLRDTDDVETLEFAMQTVARFGTPSDALMLKPLLDDQRPAGYASVDAAGRATQVQVRDVAMATIGIINDRDPRDLGFPSGETHPLVGFDVDSLGFPVGEAGEEARERVREEIDEMINAVERFEDVAPQPAKQLR